MMHPYVHEKLRELNEELLSHAPQLPPPPRRRRPAVFGPVLRAAGRVLRNAGEGLEYWGTPAPTPAETDNKLTAR